MSGVTPNKLLNLCKEGTLSKKDIKNIKDYLVYLGFSNNDIKKGEEYDYLCDMLASQIDPNNINVLPENIWNEIGISKDKLAGVLFIAKKEQEQGLNIITILSNIKNFLIKNSNIFSLVSFYKICKLVINLLYFTQGAKLSDSFISDAIIAGTFAGVAATDLIKKNENYERIYNKSFASKIFNFFLIKNNSATVTVNLDPAVSDKILNYLDNEKVNYLSICDVDNFVTISQMEICVYVMDQMFENTPLNKLDMKRIEDNLNILEKKWLVDYEKNIVDGTGYNYNQNYNLIASLTYDINEFKLLEQYNKYDYWNDILINNVTVDTIKLKDIGVFRYHLDQYRLRIYEKTIAFYKGIIEGLENVTLLVVKDNNVYHCVYGQELFLILMLSKQDIAVQCNVIRLKDVNRVRKILQEKILQEKVRSGGLNINSNLILAATKKFSAKEGDKFVGDYFLAIEENLPNLKLNSCGKEIEKIKKIQNKKGDRIYDKVDRFFTVTMKLDKKLVFGKTNVLPLLNYAMDAFDINYGKIDSNTLCFDQDFYDSNYFDIIKEMDKILYDSDYDILNGNYVVLDLYTKNNIFDRRIPVVNCVPLYCLSLLNIRAEFLSYSISLYDDLENSKIISFLLD